MREKIQEFISSYGFLHDAVIREIRYEYRQNMNEQSQIDIRINCMNKLRDWEWEELLITLKGIKEINFKEYKTTNSVVFGACYLIENDIIYIDLSTVADENQPLSDFRKSDFYIACGDMTWRVLDTRL